MHALRLLKPTMGITPGRLRRRCVARIMSIQMARHRGHGVDDREHGAKEKHARGAGARPRHQLSNRDVGSRSRLFPACRVDALIEMDISANAAAYPQISKAASSVIVYGMSKVSPRAAVCG